MVRHSLRRQTASASYFSRDHPDNRFPRQGHQGDNVNYITDTRAGYSFNTKFGIEASDFDNSNSGIARLMGADNRFRLSMSDDFLTNATVAETAPNSNLGFRFCKEPRRGVDKNSTVATLRNRNAAFQRGRFFFQVGRGAGDNARLDNRYEVILGSSIFGTETDLSLNYTIDTQFASPSWMNSADRSINWNEDSGTSQLLLAGCGAYISQPNRTGTGVGTAVGNADGVSKGTANSALVAGGHVGGIMVAHPVGQANNTANRSNILRIGGSTEGGMAVGFIAQESTNGDEYTEFVHKWINAYGVARGAVLGTTSRVTETFVRGNPENPAEVTITFTAGSAAVISGANAGNGPFSITGSILYPTPSELFHPTALVIAQFVRDTSEIFEDMHITELYPNVNNLPEKTSYMRNLDINATFASAQTLAADALYGSSGSEQFRARSAINGTTGVLYPVVNLTNADMQQTVTAAGGINSFTHVHTAANVLTQPFFASSIALRGLLFSDKGYVALDAPEYNFYGSDSWALANDLSNAYFDIREHVFDHMEADLGIPSYYWDAYSSLQLERQLITLNNFAQFDMHRKISLSWWDVLRIFDADDDFVDTNPASGWTEGSSVNRSNGTRMLTGSLQTGDTLAISCVVRNPHPEVKDVDMRLIFECVA